MKLLITEYNCDPNILTQSGDRTIFQMSIECHKDESCKMLVNKCEDLDPDWVGDAE